jgi:hypothetical protein
MSQSASLSPAAFQRLSRLLSCSTAPFREQHVIREVETQLLAAKIPWFVDEHGNRVVGVSSTREYQALLRHRSEEPVRIFIAHMDHPGFHGVKWLSERRLAVRWYGGSPVRHLAGSRVWLATEEGGLGQGRLGKVRLNSGRYGIATAEVTLDKESVPGKGLPRKVFTVVSSFAPRYGSRASVFIPGPLMTWRVCMRSWKPRAACRHNVVAGKMYRLSAC